MSQGGEPGYQDLDAYGHLADLYEETETLHLRDLFAADSDRGARLTAEAEGLRLDFSKHRVTDEIVGRLLELAREAGLEQRRDAMFAGEHINSTEDRAVLHVALRMPAGSSLEVDGRDVVSGVHEALGRMADFAERVRAREWIGHTGKPITNIVNIGIGGSDLGPVMAYRALRHYADRELTVRFVSNVDGTDFAEETRDLNPAETLFIVASKTFTTLETMTNAGSARAWLERALGAAARDHIAAVSTNLAATRDFGVGDDRVFGLWD